MYAVFTVSQPHEWMSVFLDLYEGHGLKLGTGGTLRDTCCATLSVQTYQGQCILMIIKCVYLIENTSKMQFTVWSMRWSPSLFLSLDVMFGCSIYMKPLDNTWRVFNQPALPLFFSTDGSLATIDYIEVQISNVPIPPSLTWVVNLLFDFSKSSPVSNPFPN